MTASDLPIDPVFALHRGGKIEMRSTAGSATREGLALAYTPGVARVCEAIAADPGLADTYTWRSHVVAVVSDGTAVLGLGDIGPLAALPVMEGKALLFKDFGGVDAVPIVPRHHGRRRDRRDRRAHRAELRRHQPRGHQRSALLRDRDAGCRSCSTSRSSTTTSTAPRSSCSPRCENAARLIDRPLSDLRVVVSGAGAAGVAVTKILLEAGIGDIAVGDSKGIIHAGRADLERA